MKFRSHINKSRAEARIKMKQAYWRNRVVHHKDGNPFNNDINNLMILTRKEHYRIHIQEGGIRPQKRNNRRERPTLQTLDSLLTIYNTL